MVSGEGWLSFNGSKSSKRPRIDLSSILAQRVAQEMEYKKIEMELRVERQKRDLDFQERQLDLEEKRLQLEEKHLEQRAQERESQQALVMSMMSFMQNCMNIIGRQPSS